MIKVRYVGHKRHLIGHTALGRLDSKGKFCVQVDALGHRFAHKWWRQNPQHWEQVYPVCEGCGEEVDDEICWCGEALEGHGWHNNHSAVPMGCNCFRNSI